MIAVCSSTGTSCCKRLWESVRLRMFSGNEQLLIERLKSFTSTGSRARLHASPLSILADHEIPSGPLDLMGLSAVKRSKTSSSVQRSSSGQSAEFIGAESSVESGESAELKQLWKNKFRSQLSFYRL